jgi:hypothetical protein
VAVDIGAAFVNGKFYRNSASLNINIPTPTGQARIDRIVLRADYTAQTVRAVRLAGTEGAGTPPALTQSDGVTWEISLAQVSITTAGVITVTSERTAVDQGRLPGEMAVMYVSSVDGSKHPVRDGLTYDRWYLCDGGTYGGRPTPNMTDRIPIGVGAIAATQGATGGAKTKNIAHTHAVGTLATGSESSHTHAAGTLKTDTAPSHAHQLPAETGSAKMLTTEVVGGQGVAVIGHHTTHNLGGYTVGSGTHSHTIDSGATAAGSAHDHSLSGATASGGSTTQDIMPPYIGAYWFMYSP